MTDTQKQSSMDQGMKGVGAPTLTLDSEERKIDLSFMEPSLEKSEVAAMDSGEVASAGTVDESML